MLYFSEKNWSLIGVNIIQNIYGCIQLIWTFFKKNERDVTLKVSEWTYKNFIYLQIDSM